MGRDGPGLQAQSPTINGLWAGLGFHTRALSPLIKPRGPPSKPISMHNHGLGMYGLKTQQAAGELTDADRVLCYKATK